MRNFLKRSVKLLPGLILAAGIALIAWWLGARLPLVGSPVFGIFLGMLLAGIRRPERFKPGLQWCGKTGLKTAVILLGFNMNLAMIAETGRETLVLMLLTIALALTSAVLLGKFLGVDRRTKVLVGVGTAICGGSAIAAAAPVIEASDEEVAASISTIFLFNVAAAFLFPVLGRLLGLDSRQFGVWAGTAINDTSSVLAAAWSYSDAAGALAVIVKLTRTLMIIPVCIALALLETKRRRQEKLTNGVLAAGDGGQAADTASALDVTDRRTVTDRRAAPAYLLLRIFPWFVLGFLATAGLNTLIPPPPALGDALVSAAKFLIVTAMASIGLNTRLDRLLRTGWRAMLLGLACWVILAAGALGAQMFFL